MKCALTLSVQPCGETWPRSHAPYNSEPWPQGILPRARCCDWQFVLLEMKSAFLHILQLFMEVMVTPHARRNMPHVGQNGAQGPEGHFLPPPPCFPFASGRWSCFPGCVTLIMSSQPIKSKDVIIVRLSGAYYSMILNLTYPFQAPVNECW